jgi:hypothetical protein
MGIELETTVSLAVGAPVAWQAVVLTPPLLKGQTDGQPICSKDNLTSQTPLTSP